MSEKGISSRSRDRSGPSAASKPRARATRPKAAGARLVAGQASAARTAAKVKRASNARMVGKTMEHVRRSRPAGVARSEWLKQKALETGQSVGRTGKSGARGQLKGHFVEALDVKTYNRKNLLTGKKLVPRKKSANKAYDASRVIHKKFAGGVQQKSSASGIDKAIRQMEKVKPGSASRGTARVPKDQVVAARRRAAGRIKVRGMEFTSAQADVKLDKGLADLAKRGSAATSRVRAAAKAGVGAAVTSAALGAAMEARALRRGQLSSQDFAENRAVDATEGAVSAGTSAVAGGAGGALATAALATQTGAAAAASVGALGTSAVGVIGGLGSGGAAVAGVLGGVTVAGAAPVVVGGALSIGAGMGVAKGFRHVRRRVKKRQQRRRQAKAPSMAAASNGRRGRRQTKGVAEFSQVDMERIRVYIRGRESAGSEAKDRISEELRGLGFYISDWVAPGQSFDRADLEALVRNGQLRITSAMPAQKE